MPLSIIASMKYMNLGSKGITILFVSLYRGSISMQLTPVAYNHVLHAWALLLVYLIYKLPSVLTKLLLLKEKKLWYLLLQHEYAPLQADMIVLLGFIIIGLLYGRA